MFYRILLGEGLAYPKVAIRTDSDNRSDGMKGLSIVIAFETKSLIAVG